MTDIGRIVLLYRRERCGPHPGRLLGALDDRFRERDVMDLGLDEAAAALDGVARHLRADDVVLALVDGGWDVDEIDFGPARTLRIAVDDSCDPAELTISELTWESDVQQLLDELSVRLDDSPTDTERVWVDGEDIDARFRQAAQLQTSGQHQDAIDLFETIIRSDTPGLAGRAAYGAGRSYEKLQDSNHAVRAYREAISFGPREAAAAAAYSLGRLFQRRREFDEAAAAFAEAIEFGDGAMRARAEELMRDALRRAAHA